MKASENSAVAAAAALLLAPAAVEAAGSAGNAGAFAVPSVRGRAAAWRPAATAAAAAPHFLDELNDDGDVSVPYDAAAELAYASTDRSVPFEEFKSQYEETTVSYVRSKQPASPVPYDAAARLAFLASGEVGSWAGEGGGYAEFKERYESECVELVKRKRAIREGKEVEEDEAPTGEGGVDAFFRADEESTYSGGAGGLTDDQKAAVKEIGDRLKEEVVAPIFSSEIQREVPKDTLKGALILGSALSILAGFGPVASLTSGLAAAYVAITPGPSGNLFRSVGAVAWNLSFGLASFYETYQGDKRIADAARVFVARATGAVEEKAAEPDPDLSEEARLEADVLKLVEEAEAVVEEVRKAAEQSQRDEAEAAQLAADAAAASEAAAAVADAEQALQDARIAADEAEREEEEARRLAEEAERLAEEARRAEEEAARLAEEEARLAEEAELARLEEEERLAAEAQEAFEARLAEQALIEEDEDDGAEEEMKAESFIDEEEFAAAIDLAQELDGKIAGADNFLEDLRDSERDDEEEEWEYEDDDEEEEAMPQPDEQAGGAESDIGRLAREAVERYEAEMRLKQEGTDAQKEAWQAGVEEEEAESFSPPPAAAVAAPLEPQEEEAAGAEVVEYEKLTVVLLKDELRSRGLKVSGRKAELVERLREDDASA